MADLREGLGAAPSDFAPTGSGWTTGSAYPPAPDTRPRSVTEQTSDPVDTTQSVQAAVEGAPVLDDTNSIEFMGERFRLADRIGLMAMTAFADASARGLDSEDMKGMAAMYRFIRSVIHRPPLVDENGQPVRDEQGKRLCDESEWQRFQDHADDMGAEGDELIDLVGRAMGVIAARPRQPRELSSTPSLATSPNSRESSSSPAIPPGRTDLAALSEMTPVRDLAR